jgi:hypothetical protein
METLIKENISLQNSNKILYKYKPKTKYYIFTIIIFILEITTVLFLHMIFNFQFINTIFVFSFLLLFMLGVVPYYGSHFKNEQQVYSNFYLKTSKTFEPNVYKPKFSPFFSASLVFVLISFLTTFLYYYD